MPGELTFRLIARDGKASDFDWMNIERGDIRAGKVRGLIIDRKLIVYSINIFPEFEGHGYAKKTIEMFKSHFDTIIADRVRHTAIGFWERMGFDSSKNGNYVWKRGV